MAEVGGGGRRQRGAVVDATGCLAWVREGAWGDRILMLAPDPASGWSLSNFLPGPGAEQHELERPCQCRKQCHGLAVASRGGGVRPWRPSQPDALGAPPDRVHPR